MIVKRLSKSKIIDKIVVATTNSQVDKKLIKFLKKRNIGFFG